MDNLLKLLDNKVYDFNNESIRYEQQVDFGLACQVKYDPDAKSEIFEKFIDDFTLGRKDIENCLQEFFGMALMGNTSLMFKKFLYLYGDESNGKTLFINILVKLMGSYVMSQPTDLTYDKLLRVRLLIENRDFLNKEIVKRLVGGDLMYSNRLHSNVNHSCRVVMVSNVKDDFGEDNIMRNRCIYVPCLMNTVFYPTESHQRKDDIYLYEKLNTPEVLSTMLNWLIQGALRFKKQGYVTEPKL